MMNTFKLSLLIIAYLPLSITSLPGVPFPQSSAEIRASISSSSSTAVQPITRQIQLGSGTNAEVISCIPRQNPPSSSDVSENLLSFLFGTGTTSTATNTKSEKPTIAFLHGSFHASWCWAERYMPYFSALGYPCVALSLQGTGGTPMMEEGAKKVKIASHVADLDAFLKGLSDDDTVNSLELGLGNNPKIVLIGHSFGGLTIMKWLEKNYCEDSMSSNSSSSPRNINLAGVGLVCSVPPSGNGKMTMRFIKRSLIDSYKITAGFVLKKALTDKAICRDLFFGGTEDNNGISDEDIERYQSYFERDSRVTIDLGDLAKKLPSLLVDSDTGRAPFVGNLPPSVVIGASDDFIVDGEGVGETARYMGLETPVMVTSPHDVMLGGKWKNGADAVLKWIVQAT